MITDTITTEYLDETDITALYDNHDNGQRPKPVMIELHLEGRFLNTRIDHERGNSTPMLVVHNRVLRFGIGFVPTAQTANRLLDQIVAPARVILAHSDIEWNGSNHVGVFDDPAQEAMREIENILELANEENDPSTYIGELRADEWFVDGAPVQATATDEQLRDLARQEELEALEMQEPTVLIGALAYLTRARDNLRDDPDDT